MIDIALMETFVSTRTSEFCLFNIDALEILVM